MQTLYSPSITVMGSGYVGLVTGLCFAEKGFNVTCIDTDFHKIDLINRKNSPFFEEGVTELIDKHLNKRFFATTELHHSILMSDITFIAVGTPFDGEKIDLSYIKQACSDVASVIKNKNTYHLIAIKSTVIPGTTDDVIRPIIERQSQKKVGQDFGLCSNPEFLREGQAIHDCLHPDRIVVGGTDEKSIDLLCSIYRPFAQTHMIKTNNKTAEFIKYASNSFFATLISFANQIANICSSVNNVDVMDVIRGVLLDKRLSISTEKGLVQPEFTHYVKPGCGFGGGCFPKDIRALVSYAREKQVSTDLLDGVLRINDLQPLRMIADLKKFYPELNGIKIGILGLAFKPDTDDVRCSPTLIALKALASENASLYVYDPIVRTLHDFHDSQIRYVENLESLIDAVEVILIFTAWNEFKKLPDILKHKNKKPLVIDGRRMLDKKDIGRYHGIGIGPALHESHESVLLR